MEILVWATKYDVYIHAKFEYFIDFYKYIF
jgi:hypothetical protein